MLQTEFNKTVICSLFSGLISCAKKRKYEEVYKVPEITGKEKIDTENTFIFLDPPYTREFKEYSFGNDFGDDKQIELCEVFKSMKFAKVMIVINKDEFTTNLYKDYIKHTYDLKYSTNIKNRYDNSVQHIIVCNY